MLVEQLLALRRAGICKEVIAFQEAPRILTVRQQIADRIRCSHNFIVVALVRFWPVVLEHKHNKFVDENTYVPKIICLAVKQIREPIAHLNASIQLSEVLALLLIDGDHVLLQLVERPGPLVQNVDETLH